MSLWPKQDSKTQQYYKIIYSGPNNDLFEHINEKSFKSGPEEVKLSPLILASCQKKVCKTQFQIRDHYQTIIMV